MIRGCVTCLVLSVSVGVIAPPIFCQNAGDQPAPLPLSLAAARTEALENNLNLVIEKKNPEIAEYGVVIADSEFDPRVSASLTHVQPHGEPNAVQSGSGVVLQSSRSKQTSAGVNWVHKLHFGAEYSIGLDSLRQAFRGADSYDSGLSLNWRMPLLRGFGRETNEENLLLARSAVGTSAENLRGQSETVIQQVENAYWDLRATQAALRVANESLVLSGNLLDLNRKKVEVGTLAPIEITQAEAGVASREEGLILAETAVGSAEDELRRLMGIDPGDERWGRPITPTDEPLFDAKTVDLEAALKTALEKRPELIVAHRDLQDAELRERVAKKDTRHGLDLNANFSPTGNNLDVFIDPGPDGIPGTEDDLIGRDVGNLGTSLTEITKVENYTWSASLIYSVPIGNRAAKAAAATATLQREQSEVALRNVEQNIRVDVRRAARNVESGAKRVAAARSSTVLQRKKLEAEQKKFDNGMSTSFEVLTFQTDLENAQLSEIQALLDYQKALADLERAQGTLLESRGLELDTGR